MNICRTLGINMDALRQTYWWIDPLRVSGIAPWTSMENRADISDI